MFKKKEFNHVYNEFTFPSMFSLQLPPIHKTFPPAVSCLPFLSHGKVIDKPVNLSIAAHV